MLDGLQQTLHIVCFTFLVLASFLMSIRKIPRLFVLVFGSISILGFWCNFYGEEIGGFSYIRIYATCLFYITLVYILTRNFLAASSVNLQVVIGAMSGYLIIGFLGASLIEMVDCHYAGSFRIDSTKESFDYYYFSFISLVTVGYGDVIPLSYPAKSVSILISVVGQFYLVIGLASFVGKFMNNNG